eukprot:CAMPEP_0201528360 /NCGR_PEP_ID=MMETSP0161_2-20130828/38103_1 /ASSEMBLY_ACC=CAM_ASM_000251 /TAXON_ID=180227 /ORGANISM="Neoparamoeba aestuarina, Strain SoJaBio B1-5/56/2" /LENGTH=80 /DNA_ID=CAMNT_0047929615 /DNA_START=49 /DNA_END=291 /DNA_ORIENTATION=+
MKDASMSIRWRNSAFESEVACGVRDGRRDRTGEPMENSMSKMSGCIPAPPNGEPPGIPPKPPGPNEKNCACPVGKGNAPC